MSRSALDAPPEQPLLPVPVYIYNNYFLPVRNSCLKPLNTLVLLCGRSAGKNDITPCTSKLWNNPPSSAVWAPDMSQTLYLAAACPTCQMGKKINACRHPNTYILHVANSTKQMCVQANKEHIQRLRCNQSQKLKLYGMYDLEWCSHHSGVLSLTIVPATPFWTLVS